jgi:hypothetical protein
MVKISPWQNFYKILPDGRCCIESARVAALGEQGENRILETMLKDKRAKILLLDKPFQLGPRIKSPRVSAFYMTRVHLRDLPGWPPGLARGIGQPRFPGALRCALKSARFLAEGPDGRDCVEYELERSGQVFKAWQMGDPVPLLRSVEATLNQDGTVGKKLADLQDMRLIGEE